MLPLSRRAALRGGAAAAGAAMLAGPLGARPPRGYTVVTDSLQLGEGPLIAADGSIILCDVRAREIVRIRPGGARTTIASLAGMPAGVAAGPDGALYVASIGRQSGPERVPGAVLRIDPASRALTTLVSTLDDAAFVAPDDLVFDQAGGFYFTNAGVLDAAAPIIQTGVYYCDGVSGASGVGVRRVAGPMLPTNGIDLSPDGQWLYWTEYRTGRLYRRRVVAPGTLAPPAPLMGDCIYAHPVPVMFYDSLRVDAAGFVTIALHSGARDGPSALLTLDAAGRHPVMLPMPAGMTTSLALAWQGERAAYVTTNGTIGRIPWPRAGQRPRYQPDPAFLRD